ncbi:MAG TPA: c-type cytochrome [Anaerolineales bacterium]|nr:c-type cytochrome [Anaerolineales bacterium]
MKKIFRILGLMLVSVIGLVIFAAVILYLIGNARLNKTYEYPPSDLVIPTSEEDIEYGREQTEFFCTGCHGDDLGGINDWLEMGPLGSLDSTNLTSGEGGIGDEYTDEDFVRALRHGIDPEGKPIYMPAVSATSHLSDRDLAAIIAYIRTAPPINRRLRGEQFTPIAKILMALGMVPPPPVEIVSHDIHVVAPEAGITVEYGRYMVDILDCRLCHGEDLGGANFPDPTVGIKVPGINSTGEVGFWSEEDFINTMRTGITPSGHEMDPELMPWEEVGTKLTDDELRAIWIYLQSLPPK